MVLFSVLLLSCGSVPAILNQTIEMSSHSFSHEGSLSPDFTFDGKNISPHIAWKNIPAGTKSLFLLAYDKDIPFKGVPFFTWIHWIVYNIPPNVVELPQGVSANYLEELNIKQGYTTFKDHGYGGPDPPFGEHRYFFRIIALDRELFFNTEATWYEIEKKIQDHILGVGEIYCTYGSR